MEKNNAKRNTAFFFDERTMWHNPGHTAFILPVGKWVQPVSTFPNADSPDSKRRIKNLMDISGLTKELDTKSAPPATLQDLALVHPDSYIKRLKDMSDNGGGFMSETAPIGPGSLEAALQSVGLVKAAIETVLSGEADNAYALARPCGHHCLPDEAMGACIVANTPIAIEMLRRDRGIGRIAILDWDVHHGNGTQSIFYDDPDVLTISIHQEHCFPPGYSGIEDRGGAGAEGSNINVPLLAGSGHEAYIEAMKRIAVPALKAFAPEIIIIASGLDANGFDPMARMSLHSDSFREMSRIMLETADEVCGGKLVVVQEGGYSEAYVPFCGLAIVEEISGVPTEVEDPMVDFITAQQPAERQRSLQRDLIAEMSSYLGFS